MASKKSKTTKVTVDCCYCLTTQVANEPPSSVDCVKCGRTFRVLYDMRRLYEKSNLELSKEALSYYRARIPKDPESA